MLQIHSDLKAVSRIRQTLELAPFPTLENLALSRQHCAPRAANSIASAFENVRVDLVVRRSTGLSCSRARANLRDNPCRCRLQRKRRGVKPFSKGPNEGA